MSTQARAAPCLATASVEPRIRMRTALSPVKTNSKEGPPLTPLSMLQRLIDFGVDPAHFPAEARWVRTVNVAAIASLMICLAYSSFYALLDIESLWPVVATNLGWSVGYVMVLRINGSGRHRMAVRLAMLVGLGNTITPAYFLGAGSGVYLFIALVPMVGILLSGPRDTLLRVLVIVGGAIAFASAPLVFVEAPPVLAGSFAERFLFISSALGVGLFGAFFSLYYRSLVDQAELALETARANSDRLLLNILPTHIAERLKSDESAFADRIDDVTVLFADLVDSTLLAELLTADELVDLLDRIFSEFDELIESHGLEKMATIGDAYFAVAGLDQSVDDYTASAAEVALAMRDVVSSIEVPGYGQAGVRIGLACGPVVAGVIGKRKFRYDLWGDTVNTASRMQTHGEPGMIHVTADIQRTLVGRYEVRPRGEIWVKGKGLMETYFLERLVPAAKPEAAEPAPVAS